MGKQENIKIFEDTETLCKTNSSLKQSIKNSICNQKLILQNQRREYPKVCVNLQTDVR